MLGVPVATVALRLDDVDGFDEQVEKSGSGLKRYRMAALLGTGATVPLTASFVYTSVQPHLAAVREFVGMPSGGLADEFGALPDEDDHAGDAPTAAAGDAAGGARRRRRDD
eukprot:Unigene1490_Nuclearia_a/m.4660 Unigene1490_Nuclearia_a/g.4660  ORF Unigene1490_Nuclearia_a/g.4660 Unigene1490_Nuclearia_a/m.4660 type:complete len:111 (+) Unigene1490_Nuclearia_a:2-334(+)